MDAHRRASDQQGRIHPFLTLALLALSSSCPGIRAIRLEVPPPPEDAGPPDAGPPLCVPSPIAATKDAPNLYFVLDHSGSMAWDGKWETVRSVVSDLMMSMGPNARFGAAMFPTSADGWCGAGAEVMPVRLGDSAGRASTALLHATTATPYGGTSTAGTLAALFPKLDALEGSTFVILATDGGANCNASLSCDVEECTANIDSVSFRCQPNQRPNCCAQRGVSGPAACLDTAAAIAAAGQLLEANIPTYVVGISGSSNYEDQLTQIARAGGTARAEAPHYYRVDDTDVQALEDALTQVVADILQSCQLTLSRAPMDATTLRVRQGDLGIAADSTNGWSLSGRRLRLNGSACHLWLAAGGRGLQVTEGCPSEAP